MKNETIKDKIHLFIWKMLMKNFVLKYIWEDHLTHLMFDLEAFNFDPEGITKKYQDKLDRLKSKGF